MAIRTDIFVDWTLSPRVIFISAPSVELEVQDLIDTCRHLESELTALDDDKLIGASGKEDLGGGVTVGITAELNNAKVFFESRTSPLETGTITTTDTDGVILTDSSALFIDDGLLYPGCTAWNGNSSAMATVTEIISNTQLRTLTLSGGSGASWASGDSYSIYPNVQCNITGGNLVAVDGNGVTIEAVQPSANVQVIRTSSSSATLSNLEAIQYASFQNAVWIDPNTTNTELLGNRQYPVKTLVDGVAIANEKGFSILQILNSMTLNGGTDISGFEVIGKSHVNTNITIASSATTTNLTIKNANITGVLDGGVDINGCLVGNITYVNGHIHNCGLYGTIILAGSDDAVLMNCGFVDVNNIPVVDMGGSGQNLINLDWSGDIIYRNLTSASNSISTQIDGGNVTFEATISDGSLVLTGIGQYTNNSSVIPNTNGLLEGIDLKTIRKMTFNNVVKTGDIASVKEDDGTTEYNAFNLAGGGRVKV